MSNYEREFSRVDGTHNGACIGIQKTTPYYKHAIENKKNQYGGENETGDSKNGGARSMGVSIRSILVGSYQQKRNEDKETLVIVARPHDFYTFFLYFCPYIFSNIPMTKMFKIKFKEIQEQHPPQFLLQFNDDNTIYVHVSFNTYVDK